MWPKIKEKVFSLLHPISNISKMVSKTIPSVTTLVDPPLFKTSVCLKTQEEMSWDLICQKHLPRNPSFYKTLVSKIFFSQTNTFYTDQYFGNLF